MNLWAVQTKHAGERGRPPIRQVVDAVGIGAKKGPPQRANSAGVLTATAAIVFDRPSVVGATPSDPAWQYHFVLDESESATRSQKNMLASEINFIADFGWSSLQLTLSRSLLCMDLTDKLRSSGGSASLGLLMFAVDLATSDPALVASTPDWTATQDISIHAADWWTVGPVVIDANLVRAGKKVVVVSAEVYDGRGMTDPHQLAAAIDAKPADDATTGPTLAARALVTFARIPRSAANGADEHTPEKWVGQTRYQPSTPVEGTVFSRLGMRVIDASNGVIELDRTPFVVNGIGTIMGGALALLVESAAHAMRPQLVATDMQVHFLSQVSQGPARSFATVLRDSVAHTVLNIRLVDAGARDRVLALTTVTLQRPPGR